MTTGPSISQGIQELMSPASLFPVIPYTAALKLFLSSVISYTKISELTMDIQDCETCQHC